MKAGIIIAHGLFIVTIILLIFILAAIGKEYRHPVPPIVTEPPVQNNTRNVLMVCVDVN